MGLAPEDALSVLPKGLREDLLFAFNEIISNYREHRWEPSELNGGKLCEAAYTIVAGWLDGENYPSRASKPKRFLQACMALENQYQLIPDSRSARILIPRILIGLYDIRNNRGVGHSGAEVDPNHMDATVVLYTSKWIVAELVRMLHQLPVDEATFIVEALIERESAWVWSHDDKKRVLRAGLTWRQQTLILLLAEAGEIDEDTLFRWLQHPRLGDFRQKILNPLHVERQIYYDKEKRTVHLLPPGVQSAESIIASF